MSSRVVGREMSESVEVERKREEGTGVEKRREGTGAEDEEKREDGTKFEIEVTQKKLKLFKERIGEFSERIKYLIEECEKGEESRGKINNEISELISDMRIYLVYLSTSSIPGFISEIFHSCNDKVKK